MRILIKLGDLLKGFRDVIRDAILMIYVVWMIRSDNARRHIEDRILKMDMDIKSREGK